MKNVSGYYNGTDMTLAEIRKLPYLGQYKNNWRQITIELYRLAENKVISIGTEFSGRVRNAVIESDQDHFRALDAFAHNRRYQAD